ncbi:MAG TPA: hypothetical protein VEW66_07445 [Thermomicrobiales bacterium]|nr:hypothetical protein [Thermomicrobiales bacterium]
MNQNRLPPSPLDPFLTRFLELLAERERGFTPGPESDKVAAALGQPRAFIDMLFTSARMRGLIKPTYGRGSRAAWIVSSHGLELMERQVSSIEQTGNRSQHQVEP